MPEQSAPRPSQRKIAIAKRLGFDYEVVGQGFGAYWAWTGYFRLFGWRIRLERFVSHEGAY